MSQGRVSFNRGQIFTTVALYKGDIVAVKKSFKKKITVDRAFMLEMKQVGIIVVTLNIGTLYFLQCFSPNLISR